MDSKSVDTDMENATPETKYFKMMMEDNEIGRVMSGNGGTDEDSIIGGQTIASLMDGDAIRSGKTKRDSSAAESAIPQPNTDAEQRSTISIVGYDDVSTIANDTVNETSRAFFTGNGDSKNSKPRIRLFKEYTAAITTSKNSNNNGDDYKTPEKKRRSGSRLDDDEMTQPETPPGMIRVPTPSSRSASSSSHKRTGGSFMGGAGDGKPLLLRSKRVYIVAGVLALILFVSIIALAVALRGVRGTEGDEVSSSAVNAASPEEQGSNFLNNWPGLDTAIVNNNNNNNNNSNSNNNDNDNNDSNPPPNLSFETSNPTSVDAEVVDKEVTFDETVELLLDRGAVASDKELQNNPDSPQYYATSWLTQDPNFKDYTQERLIQRWALAVLALSLGENPMLQLRNLESALLPGWMTYTDECTWFTSDETTSPCDRNRMYQIIDLRDKSLGGTLPSELGLLSDSLQNINLDGNELTGSIPKDLEELTNLLSLRLRRNNLEADLGINFGNLPNLQILDVGKNKLTGEIPYDILELKSATEIYLDYNSLSGDIPWSIGDLSTLTKLALNDNNLSGWIPDGFVELMNLEMLTMGNNQLKGELPPDICLLSNLEVLSVDCVEQGCDCCTECSSTHSPTWAPTDPPTLPPTPPPTAFPTVSPTASPTASPTTSPTPMPTAMPITDSPTTDLSTTFTTTTPTAAPIATVITTPPDECVDDIAVSSFCFAPMTNIDVSFSNCDARKDDWVGIYRVDDAFDKDNMPNPVMWSWACGTRNCRQPATQADIPLNSIHADNNRWPLPTGIYVAALARNTAMPYKAYAVSNAFVIAAQC